MRNDPASEPLPNPGNQREQEDANAPGYVGGLRPPNPLGNSASQGTDLGPADNLDAKTKSEYRVRSLKEARQPEPAPWHREVTRFASDLAELHGPFDRPTAERIARVLRAVLVPRKRPGRKPSKEVLLATELREKGVPWPRVYPQVFKGWERWPFAKRSYMRFNLRRAVAARRRRLYKGE